MSAAVAAFPRHAEEVDVTAPPAATGHHVAVGYLRAFVTVLVLAHHAVLAYHPFAPQAPASLTAEPRWWQAFPIVDSQRWGGFALLVGWNDVFFMSLMFLLSGLFVWPSQERKGGRAFLLDRARRLGLPFVVAAFVLAPLAYYPTYLVTTAEPRLAAFWGQWSSLGNWPAGPAWFLWVLLAFDTTAVLLLAVAPRWGETLGRFAEGTLERPTVFFRRLVLASALTYVPLAVLFDGMRWTTFGPFAFQTSRLVHYFVYFLAGAALGAHGIDRGLLAPRGTLARRRGRWVAASVVAFVVVTVLVIVALAPGRSPYVWGTLGGLGFAVSCAASSFACLAVFGRVFRNGGRVRLLDSLRENAFGMYLLHYVFVSWLQYALLSAPVSAVTKATVVFLGTLGLSWAATAALRRVAPMARVL